MRTRTARTFALVASTALAAGVGLVALSGTALAVGAPYAGTPIGTLDIRPATGNNLTPIDYTTSGPCPAGASFETLLFGFGLPDAGEIVTSRTAAGFSTTGPITSSVSDTLQGFADKNATTLQGQYDLVLRCTNRFGALTNGDFRSRIVFSSPTAYTATRGPGPGGAVPAPTATAPAPVPSVVPSATATATATASPPPASPPAGACTRPATVSLNPRTTLAGAAAEVTVTAPGNTIVDLFAYTRPSTTYRKVREAVVNSTGRTTFTVVPPRNTRLYALVRGCTANAGRDSQVLNVRTSLSIFVVRNGSRNYTFTGDSVPARPASGLLISLYRVSRDGSQVLTGQTRAVAADGRWTINRRFTGSGRFGFVVRTGQDLQSAPGSSNVRATLIS